MTNVKMSLRGALATKQSSNYYLSYKLNKSNFMDNQKEQVTSFQPYLLRAMYEWISDNGFTPFIDVDLTWKGIVVPAQYAKNDSLVFNISALAIKNLRMGNDAIEFDARFGGLIFHIYLPVGAIKGIFANENSCGTTFPMEMREQHAASFNSTTSSATGIQKSKTDSAKPKLRVIKSTKKPDKK
jgi:stringent starvation protein B